MVKYHLGILLTLFSTAVGSRRAIRAVGAEEATSSLSSIGPDECGGGGSISKETPSQQHQLYFTAIPDQAKTTLCARANAVRDYLENYISQTCNIDVNVAYQPVSTYDDAVDALVTKIADFGWYDGLTGVQAGLQMQSAVYLAQRIEDTKFTSVFIQASNTNMMDITDVEGKSFALGSQTSTSGSLMPMYYLTQSNVTPSSVTYTGSHDATVDAVINGEAQVGALNSMVWKNRVAANTTGGSSVFYTTEEYVDYLWVAGSGINDKWKRIKSAAAANNENDAHITDEACSNINTLLTDAFLAADASDSLEAALLEAYSTVGYVAITKGEYDPIEETGCAQGLIAAGNCKKPLPEELSAYAATPESSSASPTSKASKPKPGKDVECGDTIKGKISLEENLVCEGSGVIDGNVNAGLILDGPRAELNCEGFKITQNVADGTAAGCTVLNGYTGNLETDSERVKIIKNYCGLPFLYGIVLLNGAKAVGCNIENFLVGAYFGLEAEELSDTTASKNRYGVVVETNKRAKITNLIASYNGKDGVHARNDGKSMFVGDYKPGGSIDLKSITAANNGDDGIEIAGSDIDVIDAKANYNNDVGIVINGDAVIEGSKISISDTQANGNTSGDGIYISKTKKIELENIEANDNYSGFGIRIDTAPLDLSLKGRISLNGNIIGFGTISGFYETAGTITNFGELVANKNKSFGIILAGTKVTFSIANGASLSACENQPFDIFTPIPANTVTLEKGGSCTGSTAGAGSNPKCADCTTATGFS